MKWATVNMAENSGGGDMASVSEISDDDWRGGPAVYSDIGIRKPHQLLTAAAAAGQAVMVKAGGRKKSFLRRKA